MMTYEEFKDAFVSNIKGFLKEEYREWNIIVTPVKKVNRTLDGLLFISGDSNLNKSPTIYLNDLYEKYIQIGDLNELLECASGYIEQVLLNTCDVPEIDFSNGRDNVVFQLINTAQNEEMLNDMPHRDFHDLSIIYRMVIGIDKGGVTSIMIHNSHALMFGMSESELFKCAVENTRRIFTPTAISTYDIIRELCKDNGVPKEIVDIMIQNIPENEAPWFISNSYGINGAASILYEDMFFELAKKVDSDLYVLPLSLHGCMAVAVDASDLRELMNTVSEMNVTHVALEDRLSNQIYRYNRDKRALHLMTDTGVPIG